MYNNHPSEIRESLEDISHRVRKVKYNDLPPELEEFSYFVGYSGYCLMAIPKCLLPAAEENGNYFLFEVPFPLNYVREKGYFIHEGHLIVEGTYDFDLGLDIPEEYYSSEL